MFTERHRAYCDATQLLSDLAPDFEPAETTVLCEAVGDLFFTDDPAEALDAFAVAEERIARLAGSSRLDSRVAQFLIAAIASVGPEPTAAW